MHQRRRLTIFAGMFGNALEWYDFTIYTFFSPVIAALFFPTQDKFISLIMTFSVFALGFLVRPFGAVLFGYIGDHFGRRKALILSMILMSIPTLLLAFLPDYFKIGIAAPILLTVLRILQGTAISGELTTASAFLVEHAPAHRRGLYGSLIMCGAFFGIVVSSIVAAIIQNTMTQIDITTWGWRIGFLIGGLVGLLGLIVRIFSHETALYEKLSAQEKNNISVFTHLLGLNWRAVFLSVWLTSIMAVGNYFLIAFFNVYLTQNIGLPAKEVTIINALSLSLIIFLFPLAAMLSDYIGRKKILAAGMIGFIIFIYPIFWLLIQKNIWLALLALVIYDFLLASITGLIPTTLAELFETHNRTSALSIGYNLSLALFGGTAPIVALLLIKFTDNLYSPAWYLIACAILGLFALAYISESHKKALL